VDHAGQSVPGIAVGGLVSFALASAFVIFLLSAVSVVTNVVRAKFDAVSCWRTVVLLATARARLLRAVPRRLMVLAREHYQTDHPPQMLEVGTGI
jgi:hypothetical protein